MRKLAIILFLLLATTNIVLAQTTNLPAQAGTVDLLWSADTYTPPFYRGRALPTAHSQVTVVAMPNFGAVENLNFTWTKDGRNIGSASGRGKNVLVYTSDAAGVANDIRVSVDDTDAQLVLPVVAPRLVIYESDALQGINYEQSVDANYNLVAPEATFLAEPYYFSRASVEDNRVEFDWRLNGKKVITDLSDQRLATFAAPEEGSGENTITIGAKNLANTLQLASAKFLIKFNQQDFSF